MTPVRRSDYIETCPACGHEFPTSRLKRNLKVCPRCGKHGRMGARERLDALCDKGSFRELYRGIGSRDFLNFPKYAEKLRQAKKLTGENEAVVCGVARFGGEQCAVFAMEPGFIMASMGSAVGEKITRTFEYAMKHSLPVVGFTASGGARMQEGVLSLMQMAKVSGAVGRHGRDGGLYIAILTDPTTGGVTASFAMQGDIILAEPGALIGFAGRRVIEQTTGTKLPDDFQSAEFLLSHGFIDAIVARTELASTIALLLRQNKRRRPA